MTSSIMELAIADIDDQARRLTNVEQNVDIMRAMMEQIEAMMMHMAQNQSAPPQQWSTQHQHKVATNSEESDLPSL